MVLVPYPLLEGPEWDVDIIMDTEPGRAPPHKVHQENVMSLKPLITLDFA
jgi:hypothetical protein